MNDDKKNSVSSDFDAVISDEAKLDLFYEIGRVLAAAKTLNAAAPPILEAMGRRLRYAIGEFWVSAEGETPLRLAGVWHETSETFERFAVESRSSVFSADEDLPGRARRANAPVWIEDLSVENDFPRRISAERAGMRGAAAFPISVDGEFIGAFVFFSANTRPRDESLLTLFGAVGGSLAQFVKHERIEKSLRESRENFHSLADDAPVMIWVTDATGYCNYLSRSWYQFTGQTPEIGLGFGWLNATHPNDLKRAKDVFLTANERRAPFRVEYRLRRADGFYIWAIDSAQPSFDENGEFSGYIGSVIDITERRAAEELLRESERRYRTLFETIDEGFCLCEMIFDADGKASDYRFLEVNPAFEKMTGLQNAANRTACELIPGLEAHWFEIYGKVVLTGESIRFVDGSEVMNRWFDVYASRVGGADSRNFALLFTDISERVRAETALRESQEHLALALKVGRAGTFEWDIKNDVNIWSAEIEAMYGVPVGTFEGNFESWKKRVVPEDAERAERGIQQALAAKAIDHDFEFRAILPNGLQRWFTGRARFEYDERGEPLRMIGINVDITERKLTEIALNDARARLESTLTAGEIGTWQWNIQNDAVFADKNLARMFSVSEAHANGGKIENYIRAIHPEDRERVGEIIYQAIENGDGYEADYRLVSPKGNICWVVARGTVERDADGEPVSLPGVVLDITGRKEAEFERELLFIEAKKARQTAEQANHAKDEFIALVSHELRSPLNAMLGWTRILQKKQADEKPPITRSMSFPETRFRSRV